MNTPLITENKNGWLTVSGAQDFSVFRTFDCGQCFRFDPVSDPTHDYEVEGIAHGKYVRFAQNGDGSLYVRSSEEDFFETWLPFLSLDCDYDEINSSILSGLSGSDKLHMERAMAESRGIRILRQDPWEALCSFIISQNNNIPRIKKIIGALCEKYGERVDGGFAFPTADSLFQAGEKEIFDLKTGFRAKYIYDAAKRISEGTLTVQSVFDAGSYAEAEKLLLSVKGVGPKVCACALLFGFGYLSAFPVDVWMKKVLQNRFTEGFDPSVLGPFAGVAQQYLFYFERYVGDDR
ncbi:MAG: DNA glycosylase [Clostridia bacterium]|nr:DNA glycosylase [Clostridia bacterium]